MDWIAMCLSITGIILNARKHISCWAVWLVSNIFWGIFAYQGDSFPLLWMNLVFFCSNIYGWYNWKKSSDD